MRTRAEVILDSLSPEGHRLTTIEVTFHRWVLAEMNTHRAFSRNSASSRAIPIQKQIDRVIEHPALPVEWGRNQAGMQADELLSEPEAAHAEDIWLTARDDAVFAAARLARLGVHKQLVNRIIEPFMWHTAIITSAEWQNFLNQRSTSYSPLAQPEMRAAADAMLTDALERSTPTRLADGEWHTPYIQPEEYEYLHLELRRKVSVARCARVSYLTHAGICDLYADLELYNKLVSAWPMHASPLEHVATPDADNLFFAPVKDIDGDTVTHRMVPLVGNFIGWRQMRHSIEWERLEAA